MGENITKIKKVEHFGIARKIVAHMTTKSWTEIPHTSIIYEPDVTEFYATFKKLQSQRAEQGKSKITYNTIMLKCIVQGLKAAPALNSVLHFNSKNVTGSIEYREDIDVSIPWVLPSGEMMTICVHDIQDDTLDQLTAKLDEIARKVKNTNMNEAMYEISFDQTISEIKKGHLGVFRRIIAAKTGKHRLRLLTGEAKKKYYAIPKDDRITLDDIRQGTVTVSNVGSIMRDLKGSVALLDVIPPQVCAICLCNTQKRAMCIDHEDGTTTIEPRLISPMTLACDHRAVDGADMIPFYRALDKIFANPEVIFTW